ncbi:hypothetical protein As57867_006478, partial [Aphanomyces stellatus]
MKTFATAAAALLAVSVAADDNNIRVVGGREAPVGQYTWTVNLRKNGRFFCGGSLIAPQYVLTAGHCVADGAPDYVSIGSHYNYDAGDGEQINVDSAVAHPSFGDPLLGFDVAILKLSEPATTTPIPLASSLALGGSRAKLLGWGQTSGPQGSPSSVLKENDFTVVSNKDCQAKLRKSSQFRTWTAQDSHICAGGVSGQAACFGDSGGPLVTNGA